MNVGYQSAACKLTWREWPQSVLFPWLLLTAGSRQLTCPPPHPSPSQNNMFTHCALRQQATVVEEVVGNVGGRGRQRDATRAQGCLAPGCSTHLALEERQVGF